MGTAPEATAVASSRPSAAASLRASVEHLGLTARRVRQTPATFVNWPTLLGDMAREVLGRGPDTLTFVGRDGLVVSCPNRPGARVPVYEIFAEDTYRLDWLLGDLRHRPLRALDIGGHVGAFALALLKTHPQAKVVSYEPSPTTVAFLTRNLRDNGFADRGRVVDAAVAARTGTARFADNGAGSGQNGLATAGHEDAAAQVRTVALAEAVAAIDGPVELVKIDCEGGEFDIVLGSDAGCWDTVERVVLEHHPVPGHSWDELQERFASVGLQVQHRTATPDGYGCAWLSRSPLPAFPA